MTGRACVVLLLGLLAASPALAQTPSPAGRIKSVAGEAFVIHQGQRVAATVGTPVYEQDSLATGADGRVGLTLRDDTRLSIGPQTTIEINRFVYAQSDSQFAFVLRVVRGVVAYVSGRIAKLSPDAVRLETPSAIVGVRGTRVVIRVGA
ncbi:MAG TPA: FecR domain-containing protein [Vicinamibacterales bacterium]|nr:FecR domain-containing protein [Vicinamibacterales bacterium]